MIEFSICPPSVDPPPKPVYAIAGFIITANRYGSVVVCDWDCCLFGEGITGDTVDVPGVGTLNQPTPPLMPDCDFGSGDNISCDGISCNAPDPDTGWSGKVDGHAKYVCFSPTCAICVEGTGDYSTYVGVVVDIASLMGSLGAPQTDNYAYSNIFNNQCGNSDASKIFYVLGDPSPDNA